MKPAFSIAARHNSREGGPGLIDFNTLMDRKLEDLAFFVVVDVVIVAATCANLFE